MVDKQVPKEEPRLSPGIQGLPRAEPLTEVIPIPLRTHGQWQEILKKLSAEFSPEEVHQKKQATDRQSGRVLYVDYIEARSVQNRLDEVVGPENWEFDVEYLTEGAIKGILTVHGITKCDVGMVESTEEPTAIKGSASDALKRAAVLFGIGRYLYNQPRHWGQEGGQGLDSREPAPARQIATPASASESTFVAHCQRIGLKSQKEICNALSVALSKGESVSTALAERWLGANKTWQDAIDHVDAVVDLMNSENISATEANVKLAMGQ